MLISAMLIKGKQIKGLTKLAETASVFGLIAVGVMLGCNSGDTDGGRGKNDAEIGTQFVSDGAAGGTLAIEFEADELGVADTMDFFVTALDPRGAPLQFIRIFCETEHGIAILEPSSGGVAFEHTNANGRMSGVIGGVTPGSYLMECRGPQGFNLKARKSLRITGEIPEGFDGFPGAAGGNLGGGLIVDPPEQDVTSGSVTFTDIGGTESIIGQIDNTFDSDCGNDNPATPGDEEPFGADFFKIKILNNLEERIFVKSVTFEINNAASTTSTELLNGFTILAGEEGTIQSPFTDIGTTSVPAGASKVYAGTTTATASGTFTVTFTIEAETANGDDFTLETSATFQVAGFDNC